MPVSPNATFSEVRARLDDIVSEVRKKDLSLEASLDLYEEAIEYCNRCAELVDKPDFSDEEAQKAHGKLEADKAQSDADAPEDAKESDGEAAE